MHYLQLNQDDKKSQETLEQYLTFFLNYTIKHFSEEEELYESVGYKELENHKRLHSKFIKDIGDIVQDYKQGKHIKKIMLNLYSKGYKWLCEHITIADVHASKWIKSR